MAKRGPKPKNRTPMTDSLVITKEPEMEDTTNTTPCTHECHQEKRLEILERIVGCLGQATFSHAPGIPKPDRVKANRLKEGLREQYYGDSEK